VIATLFGGVGLVAYLTCWLVIPAEDQDADPNAVRAVVLVAWATGALVVLVLVAAAAALATIFGLGWIVFGLAAIIAAVHFSPLRTRVPPVAVLLIIGALSLPAVAAALSPVRLTFQTGQSITRPPTYRAISQTTYRSGFGTLLIDLRHTPVPSSGNTTLRIDAGLRRTIVALPLDKCVRVRINYDIHLFPAHLAALFTGRDATPFHDVVLFGHPYGYGVDGGSSASVTNQSQVAGPLLTIDFTSQGGGLYVRDYPNLMDPDLTPYWPGFPVNLEPRPFVGNEPPRVRRQMLQDWHRRLRAQQASRQQVAAELPGPCA
jgi:hypothetical protein